MILACFLRGLQQITDHRFRSVLWRGIGLTIALLVALYAALLWLIQTLTATPISLPFVGQVTWLGDLLSIGSLGVMLVLSVFLMIPVASAITSLFLDEVASAVEQTHYPALPPVVPTGLADGLRDTVNFLGVMLGANFLAFFAYALLPFAAPMIFYAVNGFLLGREYFHLVALRRIGRQEAIALGKKYRITVWMAGCLMALPLSLPVVNLVIPVLGAATFTHLFHRLNRG